MLGLFLTKMFFEISALSGINSKIIRGETSGGYGAPR
jgi:hypothetical protein